MSLDLHTTSGRLTPHLDSFLCGATKVEEGGGDHFQIHVPAGAFVSLIVPFNYPPMHQNPPGLSGHTRTGPLARSHCWRVPRGMYGVSGRISWIYALYYLACLLCRSVRWLSLRWSWAGHLVYGLVAYWCVGVMGRWGGRGLVRYLWRGIPSDAYWRLVLIRKEKEKTKKIISWPW